jgi:hypothetical protein
MSYKFGQGLNPQHSVNFSHIIMFNGNPVGSIQSISMRQSRAAERIREINASRGPVVKEIIWGGTDVELDLNKVELYDTNIFQAMGASSIYVLDEVNFIFDIVEIQYHPGLNVTPANREVAPLNQRIVTYEGCVPTSFNKTIDMADPKIIETMTVFVTKISVSAGSGSLTYL